MSSNIHTLGTEVKASSSVCAAFVVALLLQTGCSTIVHVNQPSGLSVKGSPSGASILVDGVHRGYTGVAPVQIAVEGDSGAHVVRLEKKGYLPQEFTVEKSMSGWVWGNAPFAVFPLVAAAGVGVDATCGSWYRIAPGEINVTLSPALPPPAAEATKTEGQTLVEPEGQTPAEAPVAGAEPKGQTPAPVRDENRLVPPPASEDGLEEGPKPDAPQPADDDGLAPPPSTDDGLALPPVGDFQFTP